LFKIKMLCFTVALVGIIKVGCWESVYFYENEPHKVVPIGNEIVELFCIWIAQTEGRIAINSQKCKE